MTSMQKDPAIPRLPRVREVKGSHAVWVLLLGIVAVFVFIELAGFRDTVPPRSRTYSMMVLLKQEILREVAELGEIPTSLEQLELVDEAGEPVMDGWGQEIQYVVQGDQVVLRSLGADKEPRGLAQDQDLVGIFPLRDAQGAWSDANVDWIVDPLSYHSGNYGLDLP
jgi:hypothetical protein